MKEAPQKPQRCAVYTRKSTEHNLDLAFNSLDAQREACEAYIKSQAHEGWRLLAQHYDDGGLSGASMDRPALQQMLSDVRARAIDIIVVYKVDRLTRSLADFAKLVETFDAHGVSFVSVTQSFNTTTSMGRLTLNVLLSFAQFEREVIGERVRDKIAASKRKGIWVGGPVALGYRVVDKKLVVVREEAQTVRVIFERYLALRSIRLLSEDLAANSITPRPRPGADGTSIEKTRFLVGPLGHILKNCIYVGDVAYRGEVHPGEQKPIIDRALFDAVQARLREAAVRPNPDASSTPASALLTGLLFDDRGHRMTPSHANKKGVRYRYYVSQAVLQNRKAEAGQVTRVSAPDLERLVLQAVRRWAEAVLPQPDQSMDWDLIRGQVRRITLHPDTIEIAVGGGEGSQGQCAVDDPQVDAAASSGGQTLTVPWAGTRNNGPRGLTAQSFGSPSVDPRTRDVLLTAIAKARAWIADLTEGRAVSFAAIAEREGKVERHVRLLAPLAFVSPKIITAIADDRAPPGTTVTALARTLPHDWIAQERLFGIS